MAGKIFINYRRGDEPGFTGRLFDRLEDSFAAGQLFIDIDNIEPGLDFVRVLEEQVDRCDVLLAVIGPNWLAAKDENGERRLDNPNDFVRIEIESGLKLGKRIIPVLVNNADMPRAEHLPESLRPLSRRNAVRLTHERFKADAQGLVKQLEKALQDAEAALLAATTAAEAEAKRHQEELAAKAAEAARQEKEKARLEAIAGLSPEQIAKAEELANWDFIKESKQEQDYRDHLARFPQGVTLRMARTRLEMIMWGKLGFPPTVEAIDGFLAEFPDGTRAEEAVKLLAKAKAKADSAKPKVKPEKRAEPRAPQPEHITEEMEERLARPKTASMRWIATFVLALLAASLFTPILASTDQVTALVGVAVLLAAGLALWRWLARAPKAEAETDKPRREATTHGEAVAVAAEDQRSAATWAYAAVVVSPLLYANLCLLSEWEEGLSSSLNPILYLACGAMAVTAAFAFARRKELSEGEIGLYWLGGALAAATALMISIWSGSEATTGSGAAFMLMLVSALTLVYWRRARLSSVEASLYWLGVILWLGIAAKWWFRANEWSLPGTYDASYVGAPAASLLFGLVVAAGSAILLLSRDRTSHGAEIGVYWLGCIALAVAAFGWLFTAYGWNFFSTTAWRDQITSGFIAAFGLALTSAAILIYRRRANLSALELGCYWLGVTLAALFVAGRWDSGADPYWVVSDQFVVLGVALPVAGLLAFWWHRVRHAGAEISFRRRDAAAETAVRRRANTAEVGADELSWLAWAFAAIVVSPLLYVTLVTMGEVRLFDDFATLFYLCAGAVPIAATLALVQRKTLSGDEVGLYWLGGALAAAMTLAIQYWWGSWSTREVAEITVFCGGFVLVLVSAAALAIWRWSKLSTLEVSFYWFGTVLWLAIAAKSVFQVNQWNWIGSSDPYVGVAPSGLLFGLVVALGSAILIAYRSRTPHAAEVGVYWLGCVLLAVGTFGWLFPAYYWNLFGTSSWYDQVATGYVAALALALISAAVLVYLRWSRLGAFELACYWLGVTLAAMLCAGQWNASPDVYPPSRTGELYALAVALPIGGMLTYWWPRMAATGERNRESAIGRHREARIWWIIAALLLALGLIFWLFASSPAQA